MPHIVPLYTGYRHKTPHLCSECYGLRYENESVQRKPAAFAGEIFGYGINRAAKLFRRDRFNEGWKQSQRFRQCALRDLPLKKS